VLSLIPYLQHACQLTAFAIQPKPLFISYKYFIVVTMRRNLATTAKKYTWHFQTWLSQGGGKTLWWWGLEE
jgi:hypothetical protein